MKKIEVLAPVGNREMLEAALCAGADSFYMALDDFGARAYAQNFNLENIKEVIDYCHLFGKKVFITINTLIKDSELKKALYYIEKLYEFGTDAILVQDIGLFSLLKKRLPNFEIHASTQMAVRDYYGAKALMDLGFDRVVIARETPFEEIEKITKLDIDTEVFVHGSLCVSTSGECLMSSFFGKRSANRGRCVGSCRKKYSLYSDGKFLGNDYYLNMDDLNTIEYVDKLVDAGVDSIKIEGRMKSSEYVYTIVKNYRSYIDNKIYERNDLIDIANRGYTNGFIFGQKKDYISLESSKNRRSAGKVENKNNEKFFIANGNLYIGDNLEVVTEKFKKLPFTLNRDYKNNEKVLLEKYPDALENSDVWVLNSSKLSNDLEYGLQNCRNLPITLEFSAKIGCPLQIKANYKDKNVYFESNAIAEKAQKVSLKKEDILENLSRFNDEIFKPCRIEIYADENIFIRKKDINDARRQIVDLLKKEILKDYIRKPVKLDLFELSNKNSHKKENNIEVLDNDIDLDYLKNFDNVYFRKYDEKFKGLSTYYVLDSHMDYDINELISFLKGKNIKGVVFNNYRDFAFIDNFKKENIKIRIGRYLNVFNSYALNFYKEFAEMITVSVETTFFDVNNYFSKFPIEIVTDGPLELMTMIHCPFSSIKKCGLNGCKTCKFNKGLMKDEDNHNFDVIRYDGYSKIYAKDLAKIDRKNLNENVSSLSIVLDKNEVLNKRKTNNLNYERGVL